MDSPWSFGEKTGRESVPDRQQLSQEANRDLLWSFRADVQTHGVAQASQLLSSGLKPFLPQAIKQLAAAQAGHPRPA